VETKSGGEAVEKANIATSKNCEIVSGSTTELPNNTDNVEAKSEEKDEKPKKKKSVSRKLDAVSCEDRTSTDDITQEPSSKITVIKKKKNLRKQHHQQFLYLQQLVKQMLTYVIRIAEI
jgi:hypothetical protein